MSVFGRFEPRLQEAIVARLGWSALRPVQELAGEALLSGHDAIILAPTAGGKTEAALFPALSELLRAPTSGVGVLYVAPLRALLNNQSERLETYTGMVEMRSFVWHGDTSSYDRKGFVSEPAEVLMTTPESLEVMLLSQKIDASALFGDLRMVVVDEVHALAGTDRGAHLSSVLERVTRLSRHDVQRVGLSATVGNPERLLVWLQGTSGRPGCVVDPPRPKVRRELLVSVRQEAKAMTWSLARRAGGNKSIVFCQSRARAELVAHTLGEQGIETFVHHSSVSRDERQEAERRFAVGGAACIVSTSTLELGIDVGDLDRVFQIEAPSTVSSFMQRLGRTGRRVESGGPPANTTFFCSGAWSALQATALIELAKRGWVEAVAPTSRCWPVFVHQLVALSLEGSGVAFEEAWQRLTRVPDFAGIRREEAEALVGHMLEDEALALVDGRLVVGPKVEKTFGRQHFREIYAVFFSPRPYTVVTTQGAVMGTLEQAFVDMLASGERVAFLLGGRAWVAKSIAHDVRQVEVEPAGRGEEPVWGGIAPTLLSFEVCQEMRAILGSTDGYPYHDAEARAAVEGLRASFGELVGPGSGGVAGETEDVEWFTFAGGRINWTLRFVIQALRPSWKVSADNFRVRVRGDDVTRYALGQVIAALRDVETWRDRRLWTAIGQSLPNFRLSKFDVLFPEWVKREVVAAYLIDLPAAYGWVSGRVWEPRLAQRAAISGPV